MNQSTGKKSKGKQKIEMKKVENYGDRMITFSKRKAGIFKQLMEIITMFNLHACFLAFSESGRPYTFAHPSMEKVAEWLRNPEGQQVVRDPASVIVEAYKKQRIEDLMNTYNTLSKKLAMEKEKLKQKKQWRKENKIEEMWWNKCEGLSKDELRERHDALVELHDCLVSRLERDNGGSSSSQAGPQQSGGGAA